MRTRLHNLRERLPLGSAGEAVLDDPTRNLQIAAGIFTVLVGISALTAEPLTSRATNAVLFGLLDRQNWGILRVVLGLVQVIVGPLNRRHWRWKFFTAQVQVSLAVYAYVATTITTTEPALASGQLWLVLMEVWIGARALWDRDLNGTDRRGHG